MTKADDSPEFSGSDEARKANRLYWDTDGSVNGIAEQMGLSKGRLYDLLTPLQMDAPCPECGGPLGFANRTARDQGMVVCGACGWEGHEDDVEGDTTPRPHPATQTRPFALPDGVLIGAALVGAAFGLALGRWLRR